MRCSFALALLLPLCSPAFARAGDAAPPRELIGDPRFERGCALWDPKPGKHVKYGELPGVAGSGRPTWGLAQWSSRERLEPNPPRTTAEGGRVYANSAKTVTFGPPGAEGVDLALGVFGGFEYADHPRRGGEPWAHLLVEQEFQDPPALNELTSAHLHIEARLKSFRKFDVEGYSPGLHAAQNQIFFTLSNVNPNSPGRGKLLWFGVPLFDDRERSPKGHQAQDTAVTPDQGMFIYTIPAAELTSKSLHDGEWVTIDKDLLPCMLAGMEAAWRAGFLVESRSLADYRVTGMNMGWEVPGVFDVEIEYRGLSLKATTRSAGDGRGE